MGRSWRGLQHIYLAASVGHRRGRHPITDAGDGKGAWHPHPPLGMGVLCTRAERYAPRFLNRKRAKRAGAVTLARSLDGLEVASEIRPPRIPRFLLCISPKALVTPRREKGGHCGPPRHQ